MSAELKPAKTILLRYRRVEGDLSSGHLAMQQAGEIEYTLGAFYAEKFSRMMTLFARELSAHPDAGGSILRIDKPNLLPYNLDAATLQMFRRDPVTAIRNMDGFSSKPIPMREKEEQKPIEALPIRACVDTLSDAFGEVVYIKFRAGSVECPGCGHWARVIWSHVGSHRFVCQKRCEANNVSRPVACDIHRLWAGVLVEELLTLPLDKFYLPRPWNDGRSWISKADLAARYEAYKAEKEEACSTAKTMHG